ncbi:MAG: hypothetical protein GY878_14205 [Fuerstiella sp.]|nr:hypothetical protein [Fuerstiella sp.]
MIISFALIASLWTISCGLLAATDSSRPNILLVLADDIGISGTMWGAELARPMPFWINRIAW